MKPNALLPQIVVALLLSCVAAIIAALLNQFVDDFTGARFNLSLIGLLYLAFLIRQNPIPAGRVVLMATNLGLAMLCLLLEARLSTLFWLYPAMIWFNRSLLRYSSILPILADLTLCLLGAGAALWALSHGYGLTIALWCFLLLQALHVIIPCRKKICKTERETPSADDFNRALHSAENALQQLIKKTESF